MAFRTTLWQSADIKSFVYDDANQRIYSTAFSGVPTRREHDQRLVVDETGHELVCTELFFFDILDVDENSGLKPGWQIVLDGIAYDIVKAVCLPDGDSYHHWECYAR